MKRKDPKKIFKNFLRTHKLLTKYKRNVRKCDITFEGESMYNVLSSSSSPRKFLKRSFLWSDTPEGSVYWGKIDRHWQLVWTVWTMAYNSQYGHHKEDFHN